MLSRYISEKGKIIPSRITSVSAKNRENWLAPSNAPVTSVYCRMQLCKGGIDMEVILLEHVDKLGKMGEK